MSFGLLSFLGGRVPLSGNLTFNITGPGVYMTATGGDIYYSGNFKFHVFNASGIFDVTNTGTAPNSNQIEYMAVGGGGGGSHPGSHGTGGPGVVIIRY